MLFLFMRWVPDIGSIERGDYFQESTVIYDKDKNPIYTLFNDGKRTYADYGEISDAIKNAIVSTEDKTFFENPGIDIKWLLRAGYNYISGKTTRIQGTSTLSQQLISYTLLSKERSIKRKVQEAYLSYMLNKSYSKEKILEMYLNTISYGYNANGIEEASKTFFWKSAKDVGPLWASILASLPKWPTYYSPYSHRDRLMGEVYVYPLDNPEWKISLSVAENRAHYKKMYTEFKSYLSGITLELHNDSVNICGINKEYIRNSDYSPNKSGCKELDTGEVLWFFWDIIIHDTVSNSGETESFALEYGVGRKDFVAVRMLEDNKIDGPTMKKIIYDGLEFEFKKYTENIKYPYFVMYIKEYLETKYGKDTDITQWLKVYTTLDPKLQEKAEELVKKQALINTNQYGAKSAALVSMDNSNGALLAMVGGPDYFDIENGGNNNMALARRQPWSSFKPFVYALAISKEPIGPQSPVADAKTSFGPWTPDNYDKWFKGIMTLEKALAYSRNIPAVKMFYLAGREESLIKFGRDIGFTTLKDDIWYGAPMAIWTAEVRPIDLMQAYSVLANLWIKKDIYAITKIEDSDQNVIEEHKFPDTYEPIFSPAAAYITTMILSNPEARPDGFWRSAITISGGRKVAVKTGTSNKDVSERGEKKILPRDLWTVGYSPDITTVVWAGNVDGKETKWNCDWLNCAAGIWKPFMEYALKDKARSDWKRPAWVYDYTIAKSSGRLATKDTPEDQKVSTIMAVKLTELDGGFKEELIDTLCNGPVAENTPESAIGKVFVPIASPIIDGFDPTWKNGFFTSVWSGSRSDTPCERPEWTGNISIEVKLSQTAAKKNIIESSWSGDREVKEVQISLNGTISFKEVFDELKNTWTSRTSLNLNPWDNQITVVIIDKYWFSYTETKILTLNGNTIITSDGGDALNGTDLISPISTGSTTVSIEPKIIVNNPKAGKVNLYSGDPINLRFSITATPGAREINVTFNGNRIYTASNGTVFVVPIDTGGMNPWTYPISINLIDANLKSIDKAVTITIMNR